MSKSGRRSRVLGAVTSAVVQLVFVHFAAKGVAVDSQRFGGARLVSVQPFQHAFDKFFLEFCNRFFEQNPALDHHSYQRFQLIFHGAGSELE